MQIEPEKLYVKFNPNVWADEKWLEKKIEKLAKAEKEMQDEKDKE